MEPIDYTGVTAYQPTGVAVSEPHPSEAVLSDPTNYLIIAALAFILIGGWLYHRDRQTAEGVNRPLVAMFAGLAGFAAVAAMIWPTYWGHALSFGMIFEMDDRGFNELILPTLLKAIVGAVVAGGIVFYLIPQTSKNRD